MKKNLLLAGTALVLTIVSAQAAFAAEKPELKPSVSISQLDLSSVKTGELKAIGPITGTIAGTPVAAPTLTKSDAVLDLSNVQIAEAKAIGPIVGMVAGTGVTAPSLTKSDVVLDLSNVQIAEAKAIGPVTGSYGGTTAAK